MTLFSPPEVRFSQLITQLRNSVQAADPARRRALAAAAALAAAGLVTAGCASPAGHLHADRRPGAHRVGASSSSPPHAAPTVVPSTTPAAPRSSRPATRSPSPAPAPVAAPTGPPGPGGSAGAAPAPCAATALQVSVGGANGAAGSIYYPLDFTNISAASCVLYGYPGVSFVTRPGGGHLGGAAARNATFAPAPVTLAPGAVAHASVQVVVAANYPARMCKPVTAHWLQVYPPGSYDPLYASLTAATCTGRIPGGSTLGIYVVRPGANGP